MCAAAAAALRLSHSRRHPRASTSSSCVKIPTPLRLRLHARTAPPGAGPTAPSSSPHRGTCAPSVSATTAAPRPTAGRWSGPRPPGAIRVWCAPPGSCSRDAQRRQDAIAGEEGEWGRRWCFAGPMHLGAKPVAKKKRSISRSRYVWFNKIMAGNVRVVTILSLLPIINW
jgi:hypothetical protein